MAKPLAGIRVIELANFIAGPLCATLLADMGADVVKVEPPGGDMARAMPPLENGASTSFAALNRNKRSLVLDLKRPEARDVLLRLAARSDALVEAYRPGALDKLGLSASDVRTVNPRLVYTSVSGFGKTGPYRNRAGVNLIVEAFSGTLSVTGEPGAMPTRPGIQTADVFGALFAAYATLAGLRRRRPYRRGTRGRRLAGRGLDRGRRLGGGGIFDHGQHSAAARQPPPAQRALSAVRDARQALPRIRQLERCGVRAADGRRSASRRMPATRASRPMRAARPTRSRCWRWSSRRWQNATRASSRLRSRRPASRARWSTISPRCSPTRRSSRGGVVHEVEHPQFGTLRVTRNPVLLDRDGPELTRPAPMLGQHSEEVLRELGFSADAIAQLAAAGVTRLAAPAEGAAEAAE